MTRKAIKFRRQVSSVALISFDSFHMSYSLNSWQILRMAAQHHWQIYRNRDIRRIHEDVAFGLWGRWTRHFELDCANGCTRWALLSSETFLLIRTDSIPNLYLLPIFLQCYTHRNLGWRIIVENKGQQTSGGNAGAANSIIRTNISFSILIVASMAIIQLKLIRLMSRSEIAW